MEILVLGPGCPRCEELEKTVREIAAELGSEATVAKVADLKQIAQMGVMSTPAVAVNGKIVCLGRVPSKTELRKWLAS
jgi:small redox-active disulfide protein 2